MVLHCPRPSSPPLPLVIHGQSVRGSCPSTSAARLSWPFPQLCGTRHQCWPGWGSSYLWPQPRSSLEAGMPGHPLCPAAFRLSGSVLRLRGTELLVTPGGCLMMTGRVICAGLVARPVSVDHNSCSWPGGSRRQECGSSSILMVLGWMLQPENSIGAPSPGLPPGHTHSTSVLTGHSWHQTEIPGKWGKKRSEGESKGWRHPGKTKSSWAAG